jgi:hypothetical protein
VRHILTALLLGLTIIVASTAAHGSGFYPSEVIFAKLDPDAFLQGHLGILHRYPPPFLFVAYRHLTGQGLDEEERKALADFWGPRPEAWADQDKWMKEWLAARGQILGIESPMAKSGDRAVYVNPYFSYQNCLEDTFRSALKTLNERIALFGAGSAEIREWIAGQDAVLFNCWSPKVIPAPVSPQSDPTLRADRAYQIAAAHFYAGDFDEAEKLFRAIANDRSSPWQKIAPYLVARSIIRNATLHREAPDKALLARAEVQLETILADPRLKETYPAAKRLLGFVLYRLKPEQRLSQLGSLLLQRHPDTLKQDLYDYELLVDDPTLRSGAHDDLTDWIITLQENSGFAREHAIERWRAIGSLQWLVAVLISIEGEHAYAADALKAAAGVQPGSPAYVTVLYNRVRILIERRQRDEARKLLDGHWRDAVLKASSTIVNSFHRQRMKLARNLDEWLTHAPRRPAEIVNVEDDKEKSILSQRSYFDTDGADALNKTVPLEVLQQAASRKTVPITLRREMVLATWARAILLENAEVASKMALLLQDLHPALRKDVQYYIDAPSAEEKRFAGAYIILKYPGMRPYVGVGLSRLTPIGRIDNFRDNWWCDLKKLNDAPPAPDFLGQSQKTVAQNEVSRLIQVGSAAAYLGRITINWAKSHPQDERVPEALHLVVRATRYGCFMELSTGNVSYEAFQLLHKRYPKSEWTKKTPYWFQ